MSYDRCARSPACIAACTMRRMLGMANFEVVRSQSRSSALKPRLAGLWFCCLRFASDCAWIDFCCFAMPPSGLTPLSCASPYRSLHDPIKFASCAYRFPSNRCRCPLCAVSLYRAFPALPCRSTPRSSTTTTTSPKRNIRLGASTG